MLRLAGEVCDGVRLHPFCTRRYVDEVVLPQLRAGMARSGRSREHFEISGGGFIATGPDEAAVARMVEWVRSRVAFYGSTPAYWPVLEVHGLGELGRQAQRHVQGRAVGADDRRDLRRRGAAVRRGRHARGDRAARSSAGSAAQPTRWRSRAATACTRTSRPTSCEEIRRIPSVFAGYRTTW